MEITQELVRDPVELIFADGRRYATQRWITKCSDVRDLGGMKVDCGWVRIGDPFPTEDSVSSPYYEPPRRSLWATFASLFRP